MRHYVYKTTCIANGKYYYGVHSERRKSDGYIGCGVCSNGTALSLKKKGVKSFFIDSVLKYGYKSFKKEIIEEFTNLDDAYKFEELIVNKEEVESKDCMNIKTGGKGGIVLSSCKKVSLLNTSTGEQIDFQSQAECADFLGLKNISGKRRFLKGTYVRKEFCEPVCLKNKEGEIFNFTDIVYAAKKLNIKVSRVRDLMEGRRNSSNGYFSVDFDFCNKNWQGVKGYRKTKY